MEKDMNTMTECEKLDAGLAYDFWDKGVNDRKLKAIAETKKLNAIDSGDEEAIEACLRRLFEAVVERIYHICRTKIRGRWVGVLVSVIALECKPVLPRAYMRVGIYKAGIDCFAFCVYIAV